MNMRWVIVFGVVTILALVTTPLPAQPRPGTPGPNHMMPMDVGRHFIEQMIPHHDDAVKMSDLAPAQSEHPELRDLAEKIKRVQTDEIALMRGWYQTWYGTAVPSSTMGGMAMGRSDSMVLDGARPFDKVFIEQMIPHHEMAVMMSRMALQRVSRPELRGLLQSIITSQSAEIAQMRRWYATWYGVAAPGTGPGATAGHQMGSGMSGPMSAPGHHGQSPTSGQLSPSATIRVHSAEEALEKDFRAGRMTANALPQRVAEVNRFRGELETVHLAAHLATARVLSPDQVVQYNRLAATSRRFTRQEYDAIKQELS